MSQLTALIAQGVRPPEDPVLALAKLKDLVRSQQMGDLELKNAQQSGQMNSLKLQEMQSGIQEDQQLRDLYKTNPAPSAADIYSTVGPARGTPIVKAQRDLEASQLDTKIKQSALHAAHAERLGVIAQGIHDPQTLQAGLQQAVQEGLMPAEAEQQMLHAGWTPEVQAQIQQFGAQGYKDVAAKHTADAADAAAKLAGLRNQREQTKADAEMPGVVADSKLKVLTAGGNAPIQPAQQATMSLEAKAAEESRRHNTVTEQQGNRRLGVEAARLQLEAQRNGFEQSGGVSEAAKMAAEGKMSPALLRSMMRKNPGLINQIRQIDPKFDEGNIENRFATLKEFSNTSNTKAGGQALALNTLIHHADLYMETAKELKNGTFRPGNALYNRIATEFGSAPPTNLNLIGRFFAGETGKVSTGGVPAEGEINGVLESLSRSSSPDQFDKAGRTLLGIAAGRATPLIERTKEARIDGIVHVIGDDSKQILAKYGFDPNTMKPVASGGSGGPAVGTVKQGYRFRGGDPSQPANWESVK